MAKLNSGTRIYGSANVDGMLVVGTVTPNNANVGIANTGSLQVWGGASISGNTSIGGQVTGEQLYIQGNSNLLTYSQNLENAAWKQREDYRTAQANDRYVTQEAAKTAGHIIRGRADSLNYNEMLDTHQRKTGKMPKRLVVGDV